MKTSTTAGLLPTLLLASTLGNAQESSPFIFAETTPPAPTYLTTAMQDAGCTHLSNQYPANSQISEIQTYSTCSLKAVWDAIPENYKHHSEDDGGCFPLSKFSTSNFARSQITCYKITHDSNGEKTSSQGFQLEGASEWLIKSPFAVNQKETRLLIGKQIIGEKTETKN